MKFISLVILITFSVACSSIKPPNKRIHELEQSKQLKRTCMNLLSPSNQQVRPIIAHYHLKVVKQEVVMPISGEEMLKLFENMGGIKQDKRALTSYW